MVESYWHNLLNLWYLCWYVQVGVGTSKEGLRKGGESPQAAAWYMYSTKVNQTPRVALRLLRCSPVYANMPVSRKRSIQSLQISRYGASNDYLFALSTAAELKFVIARPGGGAGVLDRVDGADRLCAMCALTR